MRAATGRPGQCRRWWPTVVAGAALLAERYGYPLLGFELPILALTVAHFQFAGFFTSPVVELAGAATLTTGMWLVVWLTWRQVRPAAPDRLTRLLLGTSAAVRVGTLLLALAWALGRAADLPHPSLSWMVATHGVAKAAGYAGCGMLA